MAAKQGFLNYYSDSNAIGIKVSGRYRRSVRISGVVVERGSTVHYMVHVIFDMMLSSTFDMDIIHATSGAVYAIICSNKVHSTVHVHVLYYIVHAHTKVYCGTLRTPEPRVKKVNFASPVCSYSPEPEPRKYIPVV